MRYIVVLLALTACGAPGTQGIPGEAGNNGANSLIALTRLSSVDSSICPSTSGLLVEAGVDTNANGLLDPKEVTSSNVVCDGVQGAAGLDAVPVTTVVFCPNDVPSYPSVFVEVGVCINHNLYAVYSANGGFLTLLTPGAYNSNAIGSSCNFTVGNDCEAQ